MKVRRHGCGRRRPRGNPPDLSKARAVAEEMARLAWRLRKEAVRQKEDGDGFEDGLFAWSLKMVEMIGLAAAAGDAEADDLRGLVSGLLFPEAGRAAASPSALELQR